MQSHPAATVQLAQQSDRGSTAVHNVCTGSGARIGPAVLQRESERAEHARVRCVWRRGSECNNFP